MKDLQMKGETEVEKRGMTFFFYVIVHRIRLGGDVRMARALQ